MSCSCGSASVRNGSATARTSEGLYRLSFVSCSECGRVGSEILFFEGRSINTGIEARNEFLQVKDGQEPTQPLNDQVPAEDVCPGETAKSLTNLERAALSSEFHPYKLFLIKGLEPVYAVCIKSPAPPHIAASPPLGIYVEHDDYLQAKLGLVRAIKEKLGLSRDTAVAVTCSRPFRLMDFEPETLSSSLEIPVETPICEPMPVTSNQDACIANEQLELAL